MPLLGALLPMLFFYQRQFSASGECCWRSHPIRYPTAHNVAPLESAPIVIIDDRGVHLNDFPEEDPVESGRTWLKIDRLFDALWRLKDNFSVLQPADPFPGVFILVADAGTPFWKVDRVLYTAKLSGYSTVEYVVAFEDD